MLKKTIAAVAVALGASVMMSAPASAAPGYAVDRLDIRSGPDRDYPTVGFARPGTRVEINGCLPDWSWCDVTARRDRGWVRGNDIQAEYRGRRIAYGAAWHVPTFTFNFGTYWNSHYRDRPFYRERVRWERHWNDRRGHDRHDRHDHRGPSRNHGHDHGRDRDHDRDRDRHN